MIFNVIRKLPPKKRAHAALAQVVVGAPKRWCDLNVAFSLKCGGECCPSSARAVANFQRSRYENPSGAHVAPDKGLSTLICINTPIAS